MRCSITSPISLILPSESDFEMKKVEIEGTKTIVIPEMIPETESGRTTRTVV